MKNNLAFIVSTVAILFIFSCRQNTENKVSNLSSSTVSISGIETSLSSSPLMVSNDFGETWNIMSSTLPSEVQASFLEQTGSEILIATDNEGIFLSIGNKTKWKPIGEGLPNKKINAIHISDDDIYAGVYKQGIYMSNDEGKIWQSINYNIQNLNVQSILKLENQLLVGNDEGVFTLLDGTIDWIETEIKAQILSLYEMRGHIVAGTSIGTAISEDDGKTWNWIRKEGAVHYTHNVGERIVELHLNGDVIYSDDWGETWHSTQYNPREGSYVYEIIEAGDYLIMSNNYGIHRSKDNGKTWELIYGTESIAFFDLIYLDNKVYGGTRTWDEYRKRKN